MATLLLSGCTRTELDSKMAEEITVGHTKCKDAQLKTEIKITPIVLDPPVIEIRCNPPNNE